MYHNFIVFILCFYAGDDSNVLFRNALANVGGNLPFVLQVILGQYLNIRWMSKGSNDKLRVEIDESGASH